MFLNCFTLSIRNRSKGLIRSIGGHCRENHEKNLSAPAAPRRYRPLFARYSPGLVGHRQRQPVDRYAQLGNSSSRLFALQ